MIDKRGCVLILSYRDGSGVELLLWSFGMRPTVRGHWLARTSHARRRLRLSTQAVIEGEDEVETDD